MVHNQLPELAEEDKPVSMLFCPFNREKDMLRECHSQTPPQSKGNAVILAVILSFAEASMP